MTSDWRAIHGYDGVYQASAGGHVRRVKAEHGTRAGRILRGWVDGATGYRRVGLSTNGRPIVRTVHDIVAKTFHGERPNGMYVNHRNGHKLDNRAHNLEWATPAENNAHAIAIGLHRVRGRVTNACPQCGTAVTGYPSQRRRFCSNACRARFIRPRLGTGCKAVAA